MLTTLKSLLFQDVTRKRKVVNRAVTAIRATAPAATTPDPASTFPKELDAVFYGYILGVQSSMDYTLNGLEKTVLRQLDELLVSDTSRSSLVPRIPAVIPRIISTLRDDESSIADLANHVGRDAVLLSEVIRLANCPLYRTGKEITSLERAICILGKNGLRQLVANAAFKPLINLNSGHFTKLSSKTLWEQSEKTAIACDCLAKRHRADRFHAYLAGIVHHVGLSVAMKTLDGAFDGNDAPRSNLFREQLVERSTKLSVVIATEWGFPPPVIGALQAQIVAPNKENRQALDTILYVSDKLAKMHVLSGQGRYTRGIEKITQRLQAQTDNHYLSCYAMLSV